MDCYPDMEMYAFILLKKMDQKEIIVFNLKNVFLLSNILSNFISLALLNNDKTYYYNKNKILHNVNIKEILI